jgi:hypothetical protein
VQAGTTWTNSSLLVELPIMYLYVQALQIQPAQDFLPQSARASKV